MKASNGIILNIFEGQLDTRYCETSKLNAYIVISHGNSSLTSKIVSSDYLPKWNQIFYLEKQTEQIELTLYHKPLILKEVLLGTCIISVATQTGWVHLFKQKQKIGSLKLCVSNEFFPLDTNEVQELYNKKMIEVQNLKNKVIEYNRKYKLEKSEYPNKKASSKLNSLINTLKIEQENYIKALNEINEKKQILKEEEEYVLREKDKICKERKKLIEDESEIKRDTFELQNNFAELQQIKNKLSLQEKIFKASHRNSKSEGRSSGVNNSPFNRAKTNAGIPHSITSFII